METIKKKPRALEVNTKSLSQPVTQSTPSKNSINPSEMTSKPYHLTTRKKRYSTSFLFNLDHKEQDYLEGKTLSKKIYGHKRSASAGNESLMLQKLQSIPDIVSENTLIDQKSFIKNLNSPTMKKKWFQIPRMSLKRQTSTPPRTGYGGLKAGLVEPPKPPPQLLFNLEWSTNDTPSPLLWGNNVCTTPDSTVSKQYDDFIPSGYPTVIEHDSPTIPSNRPKLTRRQSCPNYKMIINTGQDAIQTQSPTEISGNKKFTSSKLFSNFQRPTLKRGVSSDGVLLSTVSAPSPTSVASPLLSPSYGNLDEFKYLLFVVREPNSDKIILNFKNIKPKPSRLLRKTNIKLESKVLNVWQCELLAALNNITSLPKDQPSITPKKAEKNFITRKFILRELYTTEINFWNQLNYIKVMFSDPLILALERNSDVARSTDIDVFANLEDLMKFSSTLIIRTRNDQIRKSAGKVCQDAISDPNCHTYPNNVDIGLVLRSMAEYMEVFLRCALDYRANKKILDMRLNKKGYALYNEKLALKKETRQFNLHDYLIIPIQRITRYGLLLTDLEKNTETTHPDYENIRIVKSIINSLATAMNSAQKK